MVYIMLGTGFEDMEAICPCDILRRGGVDVKLVGLNGTTVTGSNGITVMTDCTIEQINPAAMDMIVLPGGMGGVRSILASDAAMEAIRWAWEHGKYIAAICAAPTILAKLGITDGKQATVYPGMEAEMGTAQMLDANTVRSGTVLTGRAPGAAMDFGLMLLETLTDAETAQRVRNGLVYHH